MTPREKMTHKTKYFLVGLVGLLAGAALTVNLSAVADKDAHATLPIEELRAFTDVFARIKSDYVEPVEDSKLITEAINGMLTGLDPHSAYLDAEAFKDIQIGTQGEFGGLGIEVGMEDGVVKVISPIEDTPAFKAGVKSGDLIVRLDDTPVKGMKLNDAVKMMRGKPGSSIRLTIIRQGVDRPLVLTITRAVIKVRSVKAQLLESGYGYVRITQFQEHTGNLLVEALGKLYQENKAPLKGLILDLRNNPGGLLNGAVAVSTAFIEPGSAVVETRGRSEGSDMRLTASREFYLRPMQSDFLKNLPDGVKQVPMVVLVNRGSASASEIVAGALQDHNRAVVMGTQTFGKGSVQTILPIGNDTAIKLTTARYYTPNGRSIQAKGIEPDIVVEDPARPERADSLSVREADLARHLEDPAGGERPAAPGTRANGADRPAPAVPRPDDQGSRQPAPPEPGEVVSRNDFQVNQALNLLKGLQILQRR